jgi:hypothetical protein
MDGVSKWDNEERFLGRRFRRNLKKQRNREDA